MKITWDRIRSFKRYVMMWRLIVELDVAVDQGRKPPRFYISFLHFLNVHDIAFSFYDVSRGLENMKGLSRCGLATALNTIAILTRHPMSFTKSTQTRLRPTHKGNSHYRAASQTFWKSYHGIRESYFGTLFHLDDIAWHHRQRRAIYRFQDLDHDFAWFAISLTVEVLPYCTSSYSATINIWGNSTVVLAKQLRIWF